MKWITICVAMATALAAPLAARPSAGRTVPFCTCVTGPDVCNSLADADAVFEATVASIERVPPVPWETVDPATASLFELGGHGVVELRDLVALRGDPEPIVITATESSACGYDFEIGERYLIDAYRLDDGRLAVSRCGQTRLVADAGAWIRYVQALDDVSPSTRVWGSVSFPARWVEFRREHAPLGGAQVTFAGPETWSTTTDAEGGYEIVGLPPGQYEASVTLPEASTGLGTIERRTIDLEAPRACAALNLVAPIESSISGRIVDETGAPLANVFLSVRPVQDDESSRSRPGIGIHTDTDGRYEALNLPPGRYTVELNMSGAGPRRSAPWAPARARTAEGAAIVSLPLGGDVVMATLTARHFMASRPQSVDYSRAVALEETADTSANAGLGDLDGDGDLDIVLAKGRHWPLVDFVLLNDGAGGFAQRHEVGGLPDRTYAAALADLDGDGDLDLVVGNDRPDDKRIYHNDGSGRFALAGTFGDPEWATRNVTVADLNGDRRPEIIVANRGGPDNLSNNFICVNDGGGAFPRCAPFSDQSATTIVAGDLAGDDLPDLFVPHRDGGQSYLFVNQGDGFADPKPVGPASSATRAVTLGDLDGDGLLDIVMGDERGGGAWVYLNRGDATFAEPIGVGERTDRVFALVVADLDDDGDGDIVVGNAGGPGAILVNDGSGTAFERLRFSDTEGEAAIYGLAVGDVDGDGIPDIVAARSDARNMLYLGCCR